jgi:hypothetical protein
MGAAADDQPLGQLVDDRLEVLDHQRVTVAPPPVAGDAFGKHDQIAAVLLTVDGDAAELVLADPGDPSIVVSGGGPVRKRGSGR